MFPRFFTVCVLLCLCVPARAQTSLTARLDPLFNAPALRGGIAGVQIVDAGTGKVLYAKNPDTRLLPASNAKLFTAAAALTLLGESYTWTTRVVSSQKPDAAGVVNGDVYLVGSGDASLLSTDLDDLAKQIKAGGVTRIGGAVYGDNSLFSDGPYGFGWEWDDFNDEEFPQISALTVDDGDLVLHCAAGAKPGDPVRVTPSSLLERPDVSAYTVTASTPAELHVVRPYGRRVLSVSGALPVGSRTDAAVPMFDPAGFAAATLRLALGRPIAAFYGDHQMWLHYDWPPYLGPAPFAPSAPADATNVLAAHISAPLSVYVTHMLKESDNLYAECLVRTVGVAAANKEGPPGPPSLGGGSAKAQGVSAAPLLGGRETQTASQTILPPNLGGRGGLSAGGTFQSGLAAELPAFKTLGVDMTNITLVDGCGVGRRNYVTARAICQLLVGMKRSAHWKTFYNALPIAGVDGTLKSRMTGTPAAANCHAKTGTLGAVRCLSGYVTGRNGRVYAFSVLLNNFPGTARQAGAVQDAVVELLAGQG